MEQGKKEMCISTIKRKRFRKNFKLSDFDSGSEFFYAYMDLVYKGAKIIRHKRVNLQYIKCCESYEQYKTICSYWNEITKEEFELLKEVLSYDSNNVYSVTGY